MPPFLYRCPNTGDNVQAWAADDPEDDDLTYIQVTRLACAQAHRVQSASAVREQFVLMYEEHDVLAEVLDQARKDLGVNMKGLPDKPR
jgi:hypothetical protein